MTHVEGVKYAVSVCNQEVKAIFIVSGKTKKYGDLSETGKRQTFPIRIAADAEFLNRDPNRRFLLDSEDGVSQISQELTRKYRGQSIRGIPEFHGNGSPVTIHRH